MDKEQAEKKARELLPKRDNKIKVDSGYELVRQGKNQTLAVVIPIVADLLMREAELENNYRLSKDCTDIWKNNYIMAKKQLSASQKKVEELDIILKHSKKWCDDIYDKYESLKQSQELVCYSCGEPIKYDSDRPECYCNDCLPMDSKLKQSQGKALDTSKIWDIIEAFQTPYSVNPESDPIIHGNDFKGFVKAIYESQGKVLNVEEIKVVVDIGLSDAVKGEKCGIGDMHTFTFRDYIATAIHKAQLGGRDEVS